MSETPYRRRIGDRKEGRLIRSLPPYNGLMPYIMRERSDSCNYFTDRIEVTEVDRWIRAKRGEGYKGLGMLHLFVAAYVRVVAARPGLNRFVSGQRVYARHDIEVVMTVKHSLSDDSEESSIFVKFLPSDTIFDVYRKMNDQIDTIKAEQGGNDTDKLASAFAALPRFLINWLISTIKFFDYFGLLPIWLTNASPFHGSMILTDLGSAGIPPIYHHIYNFGNLPLFISLGAKSKVNEIDDDGTVLPRKYIEFKVVSDERICDGLYFANSLKFMKHYVNNPHLLELPPEKVERDIF